MLPLIDPDYLIIEHDPDKLRAYARGLLHQLRNPSRSYSFEMVKVATVWLVGAYVDARVPLAPEMWAAIRFEATKPADPNGKAPSAASLYAVAKHVREGVGLPQQRTRRSRNKDSEPGSDAAQKSAEATIRGWRKLDHYRRNVLLYRDPRAFSRQNGVKE